MESSIESLSRPTLEPHGADVDAEEAFELVAWQRLIGASHFGTGGGGGTRGDHTNLCEKEAGR